MGITRVETVGSRQDSSLVPSSEPAPAPYVGRRAARPADGVIVEREPATPYVGRRVARVAEESAAAITAPSEFSTAGLIDTGVIARVLADLEPVDHSTSFVSDDTELLPLLTAAPPKNPGRRRATKQAHPIIGRIPSAPVLVGVAALALSVVGTVSSAHTDLAGSPATLGQIGVLGGAGGLGHGGTGSTGDRDVVSRSADRSEGIDAQVQSRNQTLQDVDNQAAKHSEVLAKNRWVVPVDRSLYHLTARFGQYGLWSNFHTGLDFAAAPGTAIHAIANGVVTSTGYDGAYGNKTVVTLADGTEIWYCHQTSFLVSPGQSVHAGETIGTVGSTGHVTGPHVHIEVRPGGGDPVDPYAAMVEHGVTP